MKRTIAAVALAVLAMPALATGLPYDQNLVDRDLPNIAERTAPVVSTPAERLPYDQMSVDRGLPNIPERATETIGRAYQETTFEQYAPA